MSRNEGRAFFLSTKNIHTCCTCTQRYLHPPFVDPMCVSGHCAPQPRFSSAIIWGAYDMCVFQGSRAWPQWGVVHRFHVLMACRKFWFSNIIEMPLPPNNVIYRVKVERWVGLR
jgi:hypothetical protein